MEQCLYSLRDALKGISAEIWVVDNQSNDGSVAYLKPRFPEVQWIENQQNAGFGKANNQALKLCKGAFILFLNPDTLLPEDCLHNCLSFLQNNPETGAMGIRMVDGSGAFLPESKRAFPGPITSFFKLVGLAAIFPTNKVFAKYYLGQLSPLQNHAIDVMAGAFMLVRKKVLEKTGGFDEQFFMYGEDIDLSYRIKQTPMPEKKVCWENYYYSTSSIIHFKGESTKKGSLNYVVMFYKAMVQFVKKHYATGRAGIFIFFIYIAIAARAFVSLLGRVVKKIGLPVVDAMVVMASLFGVYWVWSYYIRPDVIWISHLLRLALPIFTFTFLFIGALAGLYSRWYHQRRVLTALCIAIITILAVYSLLPEAWRFSRGIVLLGGIISGLLLVIIRKGLAGLGIIESFENNQKEPLIIAGSAKDFEEVRTILIKHHVANNLLGRLSVEDNEPGALMSLSQWMVAPELLPIKSIIFCISPQLSMKKVIGLLKPTLGIAYKFHYRGSHSIIGSDGSNEAGETFSETVVYRLSDPLVQKQKWITDKIFALLLLFTLPVHCLLVKNPRGLVKNIFQVLQGRLTWVGYSGNAQGLPVLPKSILGTNGVSVTLLQQLNEQTRQMLDSRYAIHYYYWMDLSLAKKGYRMLGSKPAL